MPYSDPWHRPYTTIKTVAATGTPEVLGTNQQRAHSVTFLGMKAARTNNTGRVWIQFSETDGSSGFPLASGGALTMEMPVNLHLTLDHIFIDVETAGDGVVAIWW